MWLPQVYASNKQALQWELKRVYAEARDMLAGNICSEATNVFIVYECGLWGYKHL